MTVGLTVSAGTDPSNLRTVYTVSDSLQDSTWYTLVGDGVGGDTLGNVRYVKITTTSDPTWVAWREIEIYDAVQYFSYWSDEASGDDYVPAVTQAGANLVWLDGALLDFTSRLAEASARARVIVRLDDVVWTASSVQGPPTTLLPDWQARWAALVATINASGHADAVVAFYLHDEPYHPQTCRISWSDMQILAEQVRRDFPTKARASVMDPYTMLDATKNATWVSMFDWVGFDCYGDSRSCTDASTAPVPGSCGASYGSSLDAYACRLRSWLGPQQRMIAVPQAALPLSGIPDSLVGQRTVIDENINYWHKKVLSDGKYIAVAAFDWQGCASCSPSFPGAKDLPFVQARLAQLSASLISPSQTRIYPASYWTSQTYDPGTDNWYGAFSAFDGSVDTFWNSGGYPTQWIAGMLGGSTHVTKIDLVVENGGLGTMTNWLYGWNGSTWLLLGPASNPSGPFLGTSDYQTLEWTGSADISAVMVTTTNGPEWVAWREIQLFQ